jgi:hypothetical protein
MDRLAGFHLLHVLGRKTVWLTLAPVAVAIAAVQLCFTPLFQTNDDVGMQMLAQGVGMSGERTPYILFSNILLGRLLVALYGIADWPWYRLLGLSVQAVSGLTLVAALRPREPERRSAWLWISAYLAVFGLSFLIRPQFTVVAAEAQIAAVLCLQAAWRRGRIGTGSTLLVVLLTAAATAIRLQSSLLILTLFAPQILFEVLGRCRAVSPMGAARACLSAFAPLALAVFAAMGLTAYNAVEYQRHAGWREFLEFNRLRAEFNDFERVAYNPQTAAIFDEVGWSENDVRMFRTWFFTDRQMFSLDKLRVLVARASAARPRPDAAGFIDFGREVLRDPATRTMLALLVATALAIPAGEYRRLRWLASAAVGLGVAGYLVYELNRAPPRVYQPMLALLVCEAIFLAGSAPPTRNARGRAVRCLLTAVGCVALTCCWCGWMRSELRESRRAAHVSRRFVEIAQELAQPPRRLYVTWGATFPYELVPPLDRLHEFRELRILSLGVMTQSPVVDSRLAEFGITNLYQALSQRNDILLISTPAHNQLLIDFVLEHYGTHIVAEPVAEYELGTCRGHDYRFTVYRIRQTGEHAGAVAVRTGTLVPPGRRSAGRLRSGG